jgi:hypothetical protein
VSYIGANLKDFLIIGAKNPVSYIVGVLYRGSTAHYFFHLQSTVTCLSCFDKTEFLYTIRIIDLYVSAQTALTGFLIKKDKIIRLTGVPEMRFLDKKAVMGKFVCFWLKGVIRRFFVQEILCVVGLFLLQIVICCVYRNF